MNDYDNHGATVAGISRDVVYNVLQLSRDQFHRIARDLADTRSYTRIFTELVRAETICELIVNDCDMVRLLLESRAMRCIMCGRSPEINSTASREI